MGEPLACSACGTVGPWDQGGRYGPVCSGKCFLNVKRGGAARFREPLYGGSDARRMAWVPPPRLVAQTALQIHRSLATRVGGPPPPADAGAQREDQAAVAAAAVGVLYAEEGPPAAAGPVQPSDAPPPHLRRAGVNLAATGTDAPMAPLAPQGVPPRAQRPRVEAPQAPWRLRVLREPQGPRAQVPPMRPPQVAEAPQTPRVQQRPRRSMGALGGGPSHAARGR